jgi:preprotein translocase subunit YajC
MVVILVFLTFFAFITFEVIKERRAKRKESESRLSVENAD